MIRHPAFPVDAWCVRETGLDLDMLAQTETYELEAGAPAVIRHHGSEFTLTAGRPLTLDIPPIAQPQRLTQPAGRKPTRRSELRAASRDSGLAVLVAQDDRTAEPVMREAG
jgi:hypothetical protein